VTEPVLVGELLAGAVPGLAERLAEARLIAAWPAIAGPAAPRSRAERVEGGCLHVAVDSSGWLHRLTLEEPALLERCRAIRDVRAIRFHLAPIDGAPPPVTPGTTGGEPDEAPARADAPRPVPVDSARPADNRVRVEGEVPR
jgi:hypothetical protein